MATLGSKRNWWMASGNHTHPSRFYPCPLERACVGGNSSSQCDELAGFLQGGNDSPLCGTCAPGHAFSKGNCNKCPKNDVVGVAALAVVFFGLLLYLLAAMTAFNKRLGLVSEAGREFHESEVISRITVTYLSTMSAIGDMKSRYVRAGYYWQVL